MAMRLHPIKAMFGSVLALTACFFAYLAWNDAHYAYLREADTRAAHRARPTEAVSLGKFLDLELQTQPSAALSKANFPAVQAALSEAPLSRSVLRIAGLIAEADGDTVRADAALKLSSAVSRRDALTQLWLIERSVTKNDIKGALRHYHAGLSVHPELSETLLPILSKAIAFPEVRTALRPYLANRAPWSLPLMTAAIKVGDPADVALLIIPLSSTVRDKAYEAINARLIARLVEMADFATAGRLAQAVVPGIDTNVFDSLAVNDATTDKRIGTLAWTLTEDGRILASPNGIGGFDVDVEPLTRGKVASRTVRIHGGNTYKFVQTFRSRGEATRSGAFKWEAFCIPSSPRLRVWQQITPTTHQSRRYEAAIDVPATCKGLELLLTARGPEGQHGMRAAFEAIDLKLLGE